MATYDQNAVNQIFSQSLGRNATQAEHDFFKPYVEQGYLSPYQIGQYLGGTPEALQSRLGKQQQGFSDALTANNSKVLSQAADAANASFAQNGRQFSTGQGNAVLQAGQQLAAEQSPMIANFYGQGQQGLNDLYAGTGASALNRGYGLQDAYTQRAWQQEDYARQQADFGNYLNTQNRMNLQNGLWMAAANLPGQALGAAGRKGLF